MMGCILNNLYPFSNKNFNMYKEITYSFLSLRGHINCLVVSPVEIFSSTNNENSSKISCCSIGILTLQQRHKKICDQDLIYIL